ncbi:protein SCAI-like isoform X1 [Haliotis asinina]|uniref:protein SCAI-like isoform X1 n=1 Tax=Haliotis asinina TaxID=109174 RepID=UPI003531D14A
MADEVPTMDENERKVVNEFCHLLEKSKQLFNGLRDLPQYGHKQWQSYFGRTFDVYTKLWKFQQQHRQILDSKYGLKRWQIGEIASKIGQLYYHYYLRTSETNYLNESFSFYSAIRMRAYYSKATKEESTLHDIGKSLVISHDRPDLMVKKLRYYARFIVVCLLLKKMKLVRDLVRELAKQIDDYTSAYEPDDQLEWTLVLGEIKAFIEADNIINVVDVDSSTIVLSHRLTPLNTPPLDKCAPTYLTLQEILIVGNCHEQVKFSELTLDMFRMLQTLEREPQEDLTNQIYDASPAPGRQPFMPMPRPRAVGEENGDRRRENPHKYLLYKPTYGQLNTFLASAFKELPPNGASLLYISADGCHGNAKHTDDAAYDLGGVITNSRREGDAPIKGKRPGLLKEMHCLHPGDLYPYTRKPLFLIIDSDNSSAFQNFPNLFGQPMVCLLSPEQVPTTMQDQHQKGNLFTLFMHSPLMALCHVCNIIDIPITLWDKCQTQIDKFMSESSKLFVRARKLDHSYMQFFGDDFLRLILLRFVFCYIVLILHRGFKGPSYYPMSHPPLPTDEILEHPALYKIVLDLASILEVRGLFAEPGEVDIVA